MGIGRGRDEELVARAAALAPALRAAAEATEQARHVLPASLDALGDAGIFTMMAPRRFGGREADFQTQCDVLFSASGASSIQAQVPIQRHQRDMQALANHAIMHSATAVELYGRVLCGLEPNTFLY